jgi:hypothetical protein
MLPVKGVMTTFATSQIQKLSQKKKSTLLRKEKKKGESYNNVFFGSKWEEDLLRDKRKSKKTKKGKKGKKGGRGIISLKNKKSLDQIDDDDGSIIFKHLREDGE